MRSCSYLMCHNYIKKPLFLGAHTCPTFWIQVMQFIFTIVFPHLFYAPSFTFLPEYEIIDLAFVSPLFFMTIQMLALLTSIFQYFN